MVGSMGVAAGGGGKGGVHAVENSGGNVPEQSRILKIFFHTNANFLKRIFSTFIIKWLKSEEKPQFGGRWIWRT